MGTTLKDSLTMSTTSIRNLNTSHRKVTMVGLCPLKAVISYLMTSVSPMKFETTLGYTKDDICVPYVTNTYCVTNTTRLFFNFKLIFTFSNFFLNLLWIYIREPIASLIIITHCVVYKILYNRNNVNAIQLNSFL